MQQTGGDITIICQISQTKHHSPIDFDFCDKTLFQFNSCLFASPELSKQICRGFFTWIFNVGSKHHEYKIPPKVSMSLRVPKCCYWSFFKILSHLSFSISLHPSSKGAISIPFFSDCSQISLKFQKSISKYNLNFSTCKPHQYTKPKNNIPPFPHSILMTWPSPSTKTQT